MVLGEVNNALDIITKIFDLVNLPKQKREKFFKEEIASRFDQFSKLHEAYLASFLRYEEQIANAADADWIRPLQADLERDNLMTGHLRSTLVRVSQSLPNLDDEAYASFVRAICDYFTNARVVESLGKQIHPHEIQRWRQCFSKTLDYIANETWQGVLDPNASKPPMSQKEIAQELKQISRKYTFHRKVTKQDATKRAAAQWALRDVLDDMQGQYDNVLVAFLDAQKKLLR
jgi:hypothetical protein